MMCVYTRARLRMKPTYILVPYVVLPFLFFGEHLFWRTLISDSVSTFFFRKSESAEL